MVTVKYYPTINFETTEGDFFGKDLIDMDLKPYTIDTSYQSGMCPAQKEYWKNTWTMSCPFPIMFDHWEKQQKITPHNMSEQAWEALYVEDGRHLNGPHPEVQLKINYMFWTDSPDIWIEQKQTNELAADGIELVQGSFCISAWQRPINLGIRLTRGGKFDLMKGMPVSHIKLIDRKNNGNIELVRADHIPEKILRKWDQDARYTRFNAHKAWGAIMKRVRNGFRIS